jgi:CDGSH-type Zn-finger protein/uncharacterized Fe-S cluster protein YjdI
MDEEIHEYDGEAIDVTWDRLRCIHARDCVRGLPAVFDTDRRPWVDPDEADADAVAAVVARCPTGALQYDRHDGGPAEAPPDDATVTVATDGPLFVRGDVELTDGDGATLLRDTRVALCRCGASANRPLCDGAHADAGFAAPGTVTDAGSDGDADATDAETGERAGGLVVSARRDGPLVVDGAFTLRGADGSGGRRERSAALCRCGASATKPYCDGTHAAVGFETDDD